MRRARRSLVPRRRGRRDWRHGPSASSRPSPRSPCRPFAFPPGRRVAPNRRRDPENVRDSPSVRLFAPVAEDEEAPRKAKAALERVVQTDANPQFLKVARWMRRQLPGDSELGDALSTTGDEPSLVLARRLSELGAARPSATRALGLGAMQVWQALSEAQGRGRGE